MGPKPITPSACPLKSRQTMVESLKIKSYSEKAPYANHGPQEKRTTTLTSSAGHIPNNPPSLSWWAMEKRPFLLRLAKVRPTQKRACGARHDTNSPKPDDVLSMTKTLVLIFTRACSISTSWCSASSNILMLNYRMSFRSSPPPPTWGHHTEKVFTLKPHFQCNRALRKTSMIGSFTELQNIRSGGFQRLFGLMVFQMQNEDSENWSDLSKETQAESIHKGFFFI